MSFRNFINQNIISLADTCPKLFIYQIGCFTSSEENLNHEYPEVINIYKSKYPNLVIYQILIDRVYQCHEMLSYCLNKHKEEKCDDKCYKKVVKEKYGNKVFIYPYYISNKEYNTLVEVSHFMSNFNSLSIIMEFTSIEREAYYDKNNMTDFLYISPSNCIINTNHKLFIPIINLSNLNLSNKHSFFRPDKEKTLYQYLNNISKNKMDFIEADIERRKEKLSYYQSFLNYMKMELKYGDKVIEKNYDRKNPFFYLVKKNILYRLSGYDTGSTTMLFEEFEKDSQTNLESYINEIIFNILYDLLVYKYKDENLIQDNYNTILFNNEAELRKCIELFSK